MYDKNSITINDIIDVEDFKKILNSFILATGLGAIFVSANGKFSIVPDEHTGQCPFCSLIRSDPEGVRRCTVSLVKAGKLAAQLGEPYIFRCHAGLIEFAAPVMYKDIYLGSISCGPVLMWELDEIAIGEFLDATRDLHIDHDALIKAARSVKILSGRNVQASAELLFIVANHIAEYGIITLKQRRELNKQQAKMAEVIIEKKQAEEKIKMLQSKINKSVYPIDKEYELVRRVKVGDRPGARAILNDILTSIFLSSGGDIELLKARVMELVIVISRAAVEGGASLEKLLGLNYEFITELSEKDGLDEICWWIVKVLDTFMDTVYEMQYVKNGKILGRVLDYIRRNYNKNLTLENVARYVYISPYYLSHLFKKELGVTFVEYLTKVRMDEAKRLLKEYPSLSIAAIASEVGYEDASYFSKVFKKSEGISPSRFRKNL